MQTHKSGLLTVVIEMPPEEWCNDPPELISVEGNTERESEDILSDVEWFEEVWSISDFSLLGLDKDPAYGQRHTFRGRLVGTTDHWGEYDIEWEEGKQPTEKAE